MKVLVASDGSPALVRACRVLAPLLAGERPEVRILTVVSYSIEPPPPGLDEGPLIDAAERHEAAMEAVEEASREPRAILEDVGCLVEVTHRSGNPADEILNEIAEWVPDLVVIGHRGLSLADRWLIGSVSERVLRHTHVPVLVAP